MPHQNGNVVHIEDWQSSTECAKYAFEGAVIRLDHKDYERWRRVYHAIPDFDAELQSLDDFYVDERAKGKLGNWYYRCSGALKNRHNRYLAARKERDRPTGIVGAIVNER